MAATSVHVMAKGENVSLSTMAGEPRMFSVLMHSAFGEANIDGPDVSALALGSDHRVRSDEDFIFYNQASSSDGAILITDRTDSEEVRIDSIAVDLDKMNGEVERVLVVASLDESVASTFDDASMLQVILADAADGTDLVSFDVVPDPGVTALIFAEFYRRGEEWKFRTVGQGYAGGLPSLAAEYGVSVESPAPEPTIDKVANLSSPAAPNDDSTPPPSASGSPTRLTVKRAQRPPALPEWSMSSSLSDDSEWDEARLFSVSGIGSGTERERRAVSALLAVVGGVKEFGRELTRRVGAPPGAVTTYIEPEFTIDGEKFRPDGLIRIRRGQKQWTALVEAKTSSNALAADQVERYIAVAKANSFDAVVTISNQLLGGHDDFPVEIDRRKLRKVSLHHLSWDEIRSVAIQLSMHHRIEDFTQGWVLREFVRYLQHDRSGLHGFTDMGQLWVQVRDGVKNKTIHPKDKAAVDVCHQFDQLVRHIGHDLSCLLGVDVTPNFPRNRVDSTSRVQQLTDSGVLFGSLRIPGATGPLTVSMDLRLERVSCSTTVDAASSARAVTRVKALLRQLPDAPAKTLVQSQVSGRQSVPPRSVELGGLRDDPAALTKDDERPPRRFVITLSGPLGGRGGAARGNVVHATDGLVSEFYRDVVQNLRRPRPEIDR
ncbi:MAG: TerD family protein [Corynebacteriales bacterium]|nr:TerD family protein [Mycobacteriales bacterium]